MEAALSCRLPAVSPDSLELPGGDRSMSQAWEDSADVCRGRKLNLKLGTQSCHVREPAVKVRPVPILSCTMEETCGNCLFPIEGPVLSVNKVEFHQWFPNCVLKTEGTLM
jgi:hypothetical protein